MMWHENFNRRVLNGARPISDTVQSLVRNFSSEWQNLSLFTSSSTHVVSGAFGGRSKGAGFGGEVAPPAKAPLSLAGLGCRSGLGIVVCGWH